MQNNNAFFENEKELKLIAQSLSEKLTIDGYTSLRGLKKSSALRLNKIMGRYKDIINLNLNKNKLLKWQEWLSDNYYIIEREVKFSLNNISNFKLLPYSNSGKNKATPIIYEFALAQCSVFECIITNENIIHFLQFSQKHRAFLALELEAYILMLKLAICENIYNISCKKAFFSEEASSKIMGNAIMSLKYLSSYDFEDCFSQVSIVDNLLSKDPTKIYNEMTDETKKQYRKEVSLYAKKHKITEEEAAKLLLSRAENETQENKRHIGYELFKDGNKSKEKEYITLQILIPIIFSLCIGLAFKNIVISVIVYLPLWEFLKTISDYILSKNLKPSFLPSIEYKGALPEEGKTAVVISALITSEKDISHLKERLEKIYFANRDDHLTFGILADFKDSKSQKENSDEKLIQKLQKTINDLEEAYGRQFFTIVRKRTFNKQQKTFIGWERKRGAIVELVRYIKGEECSFLLAKGATEKLKKSKYIITLDTDTSLPLSAAKELIGAMLHPLNRPIIDVKNKIVTKGYGLIAPRIGTDLRSANLSLFSKITAGFGGTETYNNPAFDVYQELFSEGIFTGKGIFDVDAFYVTISSTFEENKILSHDLLEGCFLRTGYMSNLVLVDSFPFGVLSFFDRQHRWVRGDWQASIYLQSKIFDKKSRKRENPLNAVSKWKIFDNLRRSLTPMAIVLSFFLAVIRKEYLPILIVSFLAISGSQLLSIFDMLFHNGLRVLGIKYSTKTYSAVTASFLRGLLNFIFLPYNAFVSIDATIRANYRMYISKKKMLEWVTAAQSDAKQKGTLTEYMYRFSISVMFGLLFMLSPLIIGKILGLIFVISPYIAHKISKKIIPHNKMISSEKKQRVTEYAKDMWGYFNTFLNKENNYLIPDNFQETPLGIVAHRTSPTNIGLSLLCVLTARDFGFIETERMVSLLKNCLSSIEALSKWQGHLYNWYDTEKLTPLYPRYVSTVDSGNLACSLITLAEGLQDYRNDSKEIQSLIRRITALAFAMDFKELYNEKKKLLYIGVDIDNHNKENENYYDLFMSEARMTSYYLSAKGEIPKKHWFTLGRLMTKFRGYFGLKSWTGTMFEYFMPHIFLPIYDGSLSFEAMHFALKSHKDRVKGKKIPWGISESGFYSFDASLNYQYKAFGVQRLGLKRGLDNELVISPYSTFLTLPFAFDEAYSNLESLRKRGLYGRFSFFEAADYSSGTADNKMQIVKSYMAHHLGMSFLSVANALLDNIVQTRFMRNIQMSCAEELLQEKLPSNVVVYNDVLKKEIPETSLRRAAPTKLELNHISVLNPKGAILSNGYFSSVLTDLGVGYINYYDKNITRYRNNLIKNPRGVFAIVKDGEDITSLTYAPFFDNKKGYKAHINDTYVEYFAKTQDLDLKMKVCISNDYPCEVREIKLRNNSKKNKEIELLIYFEPVLMRHCEEYAHPSFAGLFVEAEFDKNLNSLMFHRREREQKENGLYLISALTGEFKEFSVETLRENVLHRLNGTQGLSSAFDKAFTNAKSSSIDPCGAFKAKISIASKAVKTICLYTCAGNNKEQLKKTYLSLKQMGFGGVLKASNNHFQSFSKDLLMNDGEKRLVSEIVVKLFYNINFTNNNSLKPEYGLGYKQLWKYGISGDIPIILLQVKDKDDIQKAKIFVTTYLLLRKSNIACDLVFAFNEGGQYDRPIYSTLKELIKQNKADSFLEKRIGIHLANIHSDKDLIFLETAASYYVKLCEGFKINENISQSEFALAKTKASGTKTPTQGKLTDNYAGGYIEDGFVIEDKVAWSSRPPWSLILANKCFGTLVSDSSLGYTYARNARENKLTPWENDFVTDNSGEKLYIRINGEIFDVCRSGKTTFKNCCAIYEFEAENISVKATVFTGHKISAKTVALELENKGETQSRVELCYYIEPIMGISKEQNSAFLNTSLKENLIKIYNSSNSNYWKGFSYLTCTDDAFFTNDCYEFLQGIWDNGIRDNPKGVCASCGTVKMLKANGKEKTAFIFGYACSEVDMRNALNILNSPAKCEKELQKIESIKQFSNKVYISTPNKNLNLLFNNFLPMQILESRIFSRTGFYQCGGAFGFRDQLQDAIGISLLNPQLLKLQILRSCAHQFEEGDVMHWWHEILDNGKNSRGVRTRCSDDLLWLAFAVCEYIEKTKDYALLNTNVSYIKSPELKSGENEKYVCPEKSSLKENVYNHCLRAINKGYAKGENGLILFGSGDWNDGMNLVGALGKGTSVWLSMFMIMVLERFVRISDTMEDFNNKTVFAQRAKELREAVEKVSWDGKWYLRGFYDDGSKLGSIKSEECKIDILPQSFSSIAGGFQKERVSQALESAKEYLVDFEANIVKLFTPAFDKTDKNPGYIKGYIAGTRENSGQYTHSAVWYSLGLLKAGKADLAVQILNMINPINHTDTKEKALNYKAEPYVLCGDVYSNETLKGRGGWSWYTGSAGWYYKVVLEEVLGIKRRNNKLYIEPNIPSDWNDFSVKLFIESCEINIHVIKKQDFDKTNNSNVIDLNGKDHNITYYI